jgi:hypothetical protein
MFEMIVIPVCIVLYLFSLLFSIQFFLNFGYHFALLRETFIEFIAKTI